MPGLTDGSFRTIVAKVNQVEVDFSGSETWTKTKRYCISDVNQLMTVIHGRRLERHELR